MLACCIACNRTQQDDIIKTESQTDSIAIWVKNGRNKNKTNQERLAYLEKAESRSKKTSNDSLKSKYYSELSLAYLQLNDSINFRKTNAVALQLALKMHDSVNQAEAHWDLGTFFSNNTIADSAYFHYATSQRIYNAINEKELAGRMYYNMALVQKEVRDYTGSELNTIKAIALLKPEHANRRLYHCYNNLANLSKDFGEYEKALEYHDLAIEYLEKNKTQGMLVLSSKNNIGLVYKEQGDFKTAKRHFTEVLGFDSLYYKDIELYATSMNNLANSKLKLREESELPELFLHAMKIQDSIGDIFELSHTNFNLAEYYLVKTDTAIALTHLRRANTLAEQSSNYSRLLETLKMLPKVDPKNAATYVMQYIALNDSLQTEDRKIRNKFARIQFETEEVVAENELLARQRQLWTGIASAILLLSVATFVIASQRIKNQKLRFEQEQQASNQEIFNLLLAQGEKLEEGKQIEQKRISEELHDGVQGRLQGARMMLLGLNKREDVKAIEERARAIVMLKDVQEEVRTISHELSHAAYQKIHNFILSLEDLKTTVEKSAKIEINFSHAELLDWDALSGDIKINLYRIIQESLQNAVKHAQCAHVDLKLEADSEHIKVSITDDGKGFVVKKGKKGIGMRNIASRMKKIEGTWNIVSVVGNGTTVTLVIPILDTTKNSISEHKNLQKA